MTASPLLKLVAQPSQSGAIAVSDFSAYYDETCVLNNISLSVAHTGITCIVGPSGSGKSTLIRSLNRINQDETGFATQGRIEVLGQDNKLGFKRITDLRAAIGMVFQTPCVFPCSIADNVLFGVRGRKMSKLDKARLVEDSLRGAALWGEVSHRLKDSAKALSLGQQQRLCMARALAVKPQILLLDEPTASVDPVSAREIESLIKKLAQDYTVVMVTHDIRQTARIADHVVFLCDGQIIEQGPAAHMFSALAKPKTRTYLSEDYCDC